MKRLYLCWWSGGLSSAVACGIMVQAFPGECLVAYNDTHNEHPDTKVLKRECECIYGVPIMDCNSKGPYSPPGVWEHDRLLVSANGVNCSKVLKQVPGDALRKQLVREGFEVVEVFGFNPEEAHRADNMVMNYPERKFKFPLLENHLSKADCRAIVEGWGVLIPRPYLHGWANNNCWRTGCVRGGIGYWQDIAATRPQVFAEMAGREHRYSRSRGRPVTILTTRKGGRRRPLFLMPCADFPDVPRLLGEYPLQQEVEELPECNGHCSTEDVELDPMWTKASRK